MNTRRFANRQRTIALLLAVVSVVLFIPNSHISMASNVDDDDNMPTIIVHTPFPIGAVRDSWVEMEYTAQPSSGEEIVEVYYSINGNFHDYIYHAGGNGILPKGALGSARTFIIPGENRIVFTVKDSAGKEASYAVANVPVLDVGFSPPPADWSEYEKEYNKDGEWTGRWFSTSRLIFSAELGATQEQVEEVVAAIGGTIIGRSMWRYRIQVETSTQAELETLVHFVSDQYRDVGVLFLSRSSGIVENWINEDDGDTPFEAAEVSSTMTQLDTEQTILGGDLVTRLVTSGGILLFASLLLGLFLIIRKGRISK